jgi:hypothetical protein
MKKFEHTALWARLHDAGSTVGSGRTDDDAALEEFAAAVADYCRTETDLPERTRQLHFERGELAAMQKHLLIRGRINGLHALLDRAIAIIDSELGITTRQWEHPECSPSISAVRDTPDFDLHLTPKPNRLGIVGLAEVVIALSLSEEIVGANGKPAPLIRLAEAFEYIFDMSFGDIYDKQDAIFNSRKPFNRTKALDYLRALIVRKGEREEGK